MTLKISRIDTRVRLPEYTSLALKCGVTVLNSLGTTDSDYWDGGFDFTEM